MSTDDDASVTAGPIAALVGLAAAAALLGACGGEPGTGDGSPGAPDSARTAAADEPAGEAGEVDWSAADTVAVRLTEYRIQMPRTLPPGPTVFRVTNAGATEHNFEVEGEGPTGIEEAFGRNLHPTQVRSLDVLLEPGKYKIFCPVDAHARQGMLLVLEVRRAPAADTTADSAADTTADATAAAAAAAAAATTARSAD